jgi:hypothetical protein
VPVYEVLEDRGLDVIVANARDARAVPGRKSDVNDAQWLQRLHACGLLRASFRPGRDIAALRAYLRLRERHLDDAAAHIRHIQKALTFMNLQLHHVVSDVTGVTGMKIIRAKDRLLRAATVADGWGRDLPRLPSSPKYRLHAVQCWISENQQPCALLGSLLWHGPCRDPSSHNRGEVTSARTQAVDGTRA